MRPMITWRIMRGKFKSPSFRVAKHQLLYLLVAITCIHCASSRHSFHPEKKYSKQQLQEDYKLFRSILEESHPSLYWFTVKDSMDYFFEYGYSQIKDSMNEREFRTLLTYVITNVRCGHTSVRASKPYSRFLDTARMKMFPLSLKIWNDTMVITSNLHRKDSILKRGTVITSVNGYNTTQLIDTLFHYVTGDGNAITGKYQSLSNRGNFGTLYRNLFGLPDTLNILYRDAQYGEKKSRLVLYDPLKDSASQGSFTGSTKRGQKLRREVRLFAARNLQIDTSLGSAYMAVNTFSRGNGLRKFLKTSFKRIEKMNLQHLVIDVRSNGGGDAGNSTLLTQYLINHKFKIADSLYAVKRSSQYRRYIQWQPVYSMMMRFVTRKREDGKYHFGYFERHYFKPKKKFHYDKNVYVLTGGNSFSATTLFAKSLKGQSNVKIVGEETGGGGYGNSAWMIPDVTLPNTKVRFRLPKFRLVMDKDLVKEGRGVMPDIYVGPTVEAIKKGIDPKIEAAKEMIKMSNRTVSH